jgi:DNA-binding transcriptional MerR regulator
MTTPTAELRLFVDVVADCGVTYRQADYWVRRGWILAPQPGSGYQRRIAREEVEALHTMARLVIAGLTPETAARLARETNGRGRHELADGVHIVLTAPVQERRSER